MRDGLRCSSATLAAFEVPELERSEVTVFVASLETGSDKAEAEALFTAARQGVFDAPGRLARPVSVVFSRNYVKAAVGRKTEPP